MSLRQLMTADDAYDGSPAIAAALLRPGVDPDALLPRGRPGRLSEAARAADGLHRPPEPRRGARRGLPEGVRDGLRSARQGVHGSTWRRGCCPISESRPSASRSPSRSGRRRCRSRNGATCWATSRWPWATIGAARRSSGSAWRCKREPESGRAHAALGRVLQDRGAADAALRARAGARPRTIRRSSGTTREAMLARASAGRRRRAGADRALPPTPSAAASQLDPDQVAAYAGLGRSYVVAPEVGDPAEGFAALETARERLPADHSDRARPREARGGGRLGSSGRARSSRTSSPPTHGDPVVSAESDAIAELRVSAGLPSQPARVRRARLDARLDVELPRRGRAGARSLGLGGGAGTGRAVGVGAAGRDHRHRRVAEHLRPHRHRSRRRRRGRQAAEP